MANSKINTLQVRNSAGTIVAYDIDAKTLNGKSNYVDTDTTQTITGDKTTTGIFKIQNGSASGAFVLGADSQAKTLTANTRKLGRMGIPSYDSTTKTVAGISFDSQINTNYADFGGHPLNTSSLAPDVIRFTVANTHDNNNLTSNNRSLVLQIAKQSDLGDSVSPSVPKSFAGAEFFVPVKVGGNISATGAGIAETLTAKNISVSEAILAKSITENGTALADKYVVKVSGKGLSTNDYTTTEKNNLATIVSLFEDDDDTVINKISEVLAAFENYPEGDTLAGVLANKSNNTHKHSYTPEGTVSKPTITVTPSTTNVYSITAVGSLPSLTTTYTESTQTLAFSFSKGTLPTKGSATVVMTGATATSSQPTFTGTTKNTDTAND